MLPTIRRLPPLAATLMLALPAYAHDTGAPHLIHELEGWVALTIVVLSLFGAALLVKRALNR